MAIVRPAVPPDLEQLVDLAKHFAEESGLPLTFNRERARETIWGRIHDSDADLLVEWDEIVTGAVLLTYEAPYTNETCAYVEKLFVHKEFRGRGTSDALLREAAKWWKARGATCVFASATAGISEQTEKLCIRLFERHGFRVLGRVIVKEMR